ncbi:MAG: tetratricopeptide repeat protein [Acidobacteriota bacterium]|nr:tetratricopeptide repeat protein [Acidobacteriota bacterium]
MKKTALCLALALLMMSGLQAQFQGRIDGVVTDDAGKPIDRVRVTIVSQRTASIQFEVITDRQGRFRQVGLHPGYYQVSFVKDGFMLSSTEVRVSVAGEERLVVTLHAAEQVLLKSLSEADGLFLKGNKLYADKKFAEAAAVYEKAVSLSAEHWGYHLNLGLAYKKLDRPEDAMCAFRRALELNPKSYSANKELGEMLALGGDFEAAKSYYEKAVELSPDDPDAHYNLGACLVNTGESEQALEHFLKTIELDPQYADAYYRAGTALIGLNRIEDAIANLEKFLEVAPDHAQAGIARQILQAIKK